MQINQVGNTEIPMKDQKIENTAGRGGEHSSGNVTVSGTELRRVDMACPTYGKSLFAGAASAEDISADVGNVTDAAQRKNQMVVASQTTSNRDYARMEEEGYDPKNLDATEYVNVADKIKLELAKGGADVSAMGGISDQALSAMSDTTAEAVAMKNTVTRAYQQADLPEDSQKVQDGAAALMKAQETGALTEAGMKYMLGNDLEPTIDNLYKATYSEGRTQQSGTTGNANATLSMEYQSMQEQIEGVISQAGLTVNEDTLAASQWMLSQDIPLTPEHLISYQQLSQYTGNLSQEEILAAITTAVEEGSSPQDAYLIEGYSLLDQAQAITDVITNAKDAAVDELVSHDETVNVVNIAKEMQKEAATSNEEITQVQITARRQLEEVRLLMTTQAGYRLLKQGIAIDTQPLEELIDTLKALEASSQEGMPATLMQFMGDTQSTAADGINTGNIVDNYLYFTERVAGLRQMPAAILGEVSQAGQVTVDELSQTGLLRQDLYEKANASYEALWTAPRQDLGDSIGKAFQNVDDILEDLGMEATAQNQRAVRILGYNSMEITPENINRVKASDEAVGRLFGNMTGAVVTEMMKQDINPLDMKIDELNRVAEQIQDEMGSTTTQERFSKYLWKIEQNHEITPQQRESFIGVFRLIHQVEATDGAAIGSLVQAGVEPTMRNLMTAVRSSKHSNREYGIDDSFGALDSYQPDSLSITQQIEVAYQSDCIRDVADEITPNKMMNFQREDTYMNMTPEQLADALIEMDDQTDAQLDEAYAAMNRQEIVQSAASEEQVYQALEQYDIPTTPANLQAMYQLMTNPNGMYRTLMKNYPDTGESTDDTSTDDWNMDYDALMEDLIQDMGEAIKTPEDMARAQQKLAETAENVMKNMLIEKDVSSIDIRGMKLVTTQIMALGQISNKSETYSIPIMVADEVGNLSLKIVRGEDEQGLVDIAFDMESTGAVAASFRYENGTIEGTINSSRQDTRDLLAEHMGLLAERMTEAAGAGVSFAFGWDSRLDVSDFYAPQGESNQQSQKLDDTQEQAQEHTQIQTRVLYGLAKSFVDTLGEIAG